MLAWWTPARRRGVEFLDDPGVPDTIRDRSMADVARANVLFGGSRAMLAGLHDALPTLPARAVLLDVGTGTADIAVRARDAATRERVALTSVGLDLSVSLLKRAGTRLDAAVVGDAMHLPIADASVDVVACSQLLHHFETDDARRVVAELHRVSRHWVVISDLSRSWLAAAGFWVASVALRFHPVTRHDGVTSVLRGFTAAELRQLVFEVTGVQPRVRRGAFWRLSATWAKSG